MATIKKDGLVWRVQLKKKGVRDSGTFDSKREAQEWAIKREAEILETGGGQGNLKNCTLEELFERYLELVSIHKKGGKVERKRLKFFSENHPVFSDLIKRGAKVQEITRGHIAQWRDERLKQVQVGSVLREKNLLCSVFSRAVEWEMLEDSPFKNVRWPSEPDARERRISEEEINQIVFHLDNWDRQSKPESNRQIVAAIFLLAIETCMRLSELKLLETKEVDLEKRVIRIRADRLKENSRKSVGLTMEAVRLLKLCKVDGFYWLGSGTINTSYYFKQAVRSAGIKNLRFHDTRHEGITRLADKLSPYQLSKTVGHRDLNRLMSYYEGQTEDFVHKFD